MIKTEKEIKELKTEAFKALALLRLEVHESVVKDIMNKVTALINALEVNLAVTEKVSERVCGTLTSKNFSKIIEEIRKGD